MPPSHSALRRLGRVPSRLGKVVSGAWPSIKLRFSERFERIPIDLVMSEYGFSLSSTGWHYIRDLVAGYDNDPARPMRSSTFYQFFQHPRIRAIRTLNDLLFLHDPDNFEKTRNSIFYLGTYPWGGWIKRDDITGGEPFGHYYDLMEKKETRDIYGYRRNPWYQPEDEYPLELEWEHTTRVFDTLRHGYHPFRHGNYPELVFMARRDGQRRAIIFQGQHRLATIAHLGHQKVTGMIPSYSLGTIHEDDVEKWFFVRNGYCTPESALLFFHAFFQLTGRERLEHLGLPANY